MENKMKLASNKYTVFKQQFISNLVKSAFKKKKRKLMAMREVTCFN